MSKKYKSGEQALIRMIEAIEKVELYISKTTEKEFLQQQESFDAVCLQFTQLGEQTNILTSSADRIVQKFPDEVDWAALIGLRNRISHNYVSVDAAQVWEFATSEMKDLKSSLQRLLKKRYGR